MQLENTGYKHVYYYTLLPTAEIKDLPVAPTLACRENTLMEEIQARHRKEQKELQGLITGKKKSASKKTRKGVNDECARLEAELKERQEAEIAELNGDVPVAVENGVSDEKEHEDEDEDEDKDETGLANGVSGLAIETSKESTAPERTGKKPNRQKARLARRAAEKEEEAAKAAEEAADMPDLRAKEQETMEVAIKSRGLKMKEIRADGHCLYSAVADQLSMRSIGLAPRIRPQIAQGEEPYRTVRRTAAEYITENKDDFEPFLEESLNEYVRKVGETGEWGGQLELAALAKAYGVDISVLDGNGGVHEIEGAEQKGEDRRIWLAYYRHGFGLGEHYNSLRENS
jgi:OTU domain-containing protein 6